MPRFICDTTSTYAIDLDPTKFTEEFMSEFRETQYNFHSLYEHAEHLGQLFTRGLAEGDDFIEGYGKPSEMGIKVTFIGTETESIHADAEVV